MPFRREIPQDELRDKQKQRGDNRQGSVYQPSRGGWYKPNQPKKR